MAKYRFQVFVRPEAWFLRGTSQDVKGMWWINDFVSRLLVPVGLEAFEEALSAARAATRRDLPSPESLRHSPPDPGVRALLALAAVSSVRAFTKGVRVVNVSVDDGGTTVEGAVVRGTTVIGLGETERFIPADDTEALFRSVEELARTDTRA